MKKFIQTCLYILLMLTFVPAILLLGIGSLIRLLGDNKISDILEFPALWLAGEFLTAHSEVVESQEPILPRVFTTNEIIDYVVDYYKTHPRAVSVNGMCMYLTKRGYRCAHSICLDDSVDLKECVGGTTGLIVKFGDKIHKPEFRGNEIQFWQDIQSLHDNQNFWFTNHSGGVDLTKEGELEVQRMKRYHKRDEVSTL